MNIFKKSFIMAACTATVLINTGIPLKVQAESNVPVYRLYNSNSGEHFLTTNSAERENLVQCGWNDEGIGFYENNTGNAVYRLYNPNAGEHHYTLSSTERENLIEAGWRDEGISFYSAASTDLPVYRAYNPNQFANNHNFTVNISEQNYLVGLGWQDESIAWYAAGKGDQNAKLPGYYHYNLAYYSQLDSRWASRRYGSYTFASSGCVPTCMAMILQGIKGTTILPTDTGTYAYNNSTYNRGHYGSPDSVVAACASHWGVHCDNIQSESQLVDALKHGKPVVIVADGVNDFLPCNAAHCVVMHGYANGSTYISDPYYAKNNTWWNVSYIWSLRTTKQFLLDNSAYYCYAIY